MILCFILVQAPAHAAFPPFGSDEGVIVWETNSGHSVLEQRADEVFYPASTTKLMTALLLMENVDNLSSVVTVGEEVNDYGWSDSTAGLELGQTLNYRDLLYAMLLPSGNDAAGTIGVNVGRLLLKDPQADKPTAEARFIEEMNRKAESLGLTHTHFMNPSGRFDPNHYTTPREMALIASEAFKYDEVVKAASTQAYVLTGATGEQWPIHNTNQMLYPTATVRATDLDPNAPAGTPDQAVSNPYYTDLLTAAKTGSTDEGGRTFVYYSRQGDADVIGVLFKTGDAEIFSQTKAILDELNANYKEGVIGDGSDGFTQEVVGLENVNFRNTPNLEIGTDRVINIYDKKDQMDGYTTSVRWDEDYVNADDKDKLTLVGNVTPGDKVGAVLVSKGGEVLETVPIYARNELNVKDWTDFVYENILWFALGGLALVLLLLAIVCYMLGRRKRGDSKRRARRLARQQTAMRKKAAGPYAHHNIDSKF